MFWDQAGAAGTSPSATNPRAAAMSPAIGFSRAPRASIFCGASMKRTAISLVYLGVILTTALLAGCAAPPVGATVHAATSPTARLGAGDALGMVMMAGSDELDNQDTRYATANDDR